MKALVTGGAGFVGSHLVERLVGDGWHVVVIDNCSTGRLEHLAAVRGQIEMIVAAVPDGLQVFDGARDFDVIYHLAARVGVKHIATDPLAMLVEHAEDTRAVCRYAAVGEAMLVLASSSEVYGASTATPFRETDASLIGASTHWRWGYAISKLWAEHVALAHHRQYGLRVVIPRLFNVAGPRQRADTGMVLPTFARAAVGGQPIPVHGDGTQRRCFSHVADVVDALVALAASPAADGQVVNVGTRQMVRILDVAEAVVRQVREVYQIEADVEHIPYGRLDRGAALEAMEVRIPETTRLRTLLGHELPDRWADIVRDVCAYWHAALTAGEEEAA